jgi:hypothetical protein
VHFCPKCQAEVLSGILDFWVRNFQLRMCVLTRSADSTKVGLLAPAAALSPFQTKQIPFSSFRWTLLSPSLFLPSVRLLPPWKLLLCSLKKYTMFNLSYFLTFPYVFNINLSGAVNTTTSHTFETLSVSLISQPWQVLFYHLTIQSFFLFVFLRHS